ncbi:MAG TPA: hypothetical protein VKY92_27155 [Verrucomicrobiae bacterium]|nr:hypothetical protein [Verrucomicrobiae bacterium]
MNFETHRDWTWVSASVLAVLTVVPAACNAAENDALPAVQFLDSLGTLSAISVRGENLQQTVQCAKYLGVRWPRAGIEGDVPIAQFVQLHQEAGYLPRPCKPFKL